MHSHDIHHFIHSSHSSHHRIHHSIHSHPADSSHHDLLYSPMQMAATYVLYFIGRYVEDWGGHTAQIWPIQVLRSTACSDQKTFFLL
jgi:hypothetical protein